MVPAHHSSKILATFACALQLGQLVRAVPTKKLLEPDHVQARLQASYTLSDGKLSATLGGVGGVFGELIGNEG